MFYVYAYLDPRKPGQYCYRSINFLYEPLYIGKGKGSRYLTHLNCLRNKKEGSYLKNKLESILNQFSKQEMKKYILVLQSNLVESEAFNLEIRLIREIGRHDLGLGSLVNNTNGGDGVSGYIHPTEVLKKRKTDFSIIEEEFKKRSYTLLTKEGEYPNSFTKLDYTCPEGHRGCISWASFREGCGCLTCAEHQKRVDFSVIEEEFQKRGYTLFTKKDEYRGVFAKLRCICPNGHECAIAWNNFQYGHSCPYCKKVRVDFTTIEGKFKERGYTLLTKKDEYKNAHAKLNYICQEKHEGSISWSDFKQGRGCPVCACRKRSEALQGEKNPNFGKRVSEEMRKRLSESHKRRKVEVKSNG